MRDSQLIVNILNYIAQIWFKYPQLSFCQLIEKCIPTLKQKNYTDEELIYGLSQLGDNVIPGELISSDIVVL